MRKNKIIKVIVCGFTAFATVFGIVLLIKRNRK